MRDEKCKFGTTIICVYIRLLNKEQGMNRQDSKEIVGSYELTPASLSLAAAKLPASPYREHVLKDKNV
jgi:hypothetical protein